MARNEGRGSLLDHRHHLRADLAVDVEAAVRKAETRDQRSETRGSRQVSFDLRSLKEQRKVDKRSEIRGSRRFVLISDLLSLISAFTRT